jgi:hypothetical protein
MAKKKTVVEPTLKDVYSVLTEFVGFTQNQFTKIEGRFDKNEKTLGLMNNALQIANREIKDLKETTEHIDKRLRHVEQDVLSIKEDVETLGKIVGRDSSTIKSHGRRLINLERSKF